MQISDVPLRPSLASEMPGFFEHTPHVRQSRAVHPPATSRIVFGMPSRWPFGTQEFCLSPDISERENKRSSSRHASPDGRPPALETLSETSCWVFILDLGPKPYLDKKGKARYIYCIECQATPYQGKPITFSSTVPVSQPRLVRGTSVLVGSRDWVIGVLST